MEGNLPAVWGIGTMETGPLNVAMFTETFLPHANGVTTSILNARRGLGRRGHKVVVYSAGPPVLENETVHYYGGKIFPLYPDFPMAIYPTRVGRQNRRLVAEQDADVVHVHAPGPMGVRGYRAAKRHRLPLVVTYHTVYEPLARYAPRGLRTVFSVGASGIERMLNRRCQVLIAPTHAAKRELLAKYPRLAPKIRVVPTGIDLNLFRPGLDGSPVRAAWGFESGERVLLYLGRLSYEKRIDILMRAFARLRRQHTDLRLVVAGTGPADAELQALARGMGLEGVVRFPGHVADEDVPLYYNACDVFVSASDFETQGLTVLEALACGRPCAVAGARGFLDVVRDGDNGFLFPPDSVDGAVHGIELALHAPAALRERARSSAMLWGIEHCVGLLERAYTEAVEDPPEIP